MHREKQPIEPLDTWQSLTVPYLVELMIKSMADYPESVSVQEVKGQQSTVLEIKVDERDHGKLIGRRGKTVGSLREVLLAVGGKQKRRYQVMLV
ncbi:MAG: KH domain-containing protein [Myxococcota bacterium]